jgi:predicted esterase/fibronectin type 3 domain-containing protein
MQKTFFLFLLSVSTVFAQNSDTALISITNYKLVAGTYSWRGTGTFHDMTNWDSSPYGEGHLRQKDGDTWKFRLNYRFLLPGSYSSSYEEGYPLLILFHGAGERGNCWVDNCYCVDCDPNATPKPSSDPQFLNNDHMLQIGGRPFYDAVNRAGSRKAGDPSLDPRAFPGFVLFPQCESSWGSAESSSSAVSYAIRVVRLLTRQYNINPNRIYVAGLSMGGQAVLKALSMADWLFAAAITMSPIPYHEQLDYVGARSIPLWVFQGGYDLNPKPYHSETLVKKFKAAGGNARYTFYPEAGHNTWTAAFKEPDFFSWLLQFRKNDVHVQFNYPFICATNTKGAELLMPAGFSSYQWEKDGELISDQKNSSLTVTEEGKYRGRFMSATSGWNAWSREVEIRKSNPPAPPVMQNGTTFLPDLNGSENAVLLTENKYEHYIWERNGSPTSFADTNVALIDKGVCTRECRNNGTYTLKVSDFSGCESAPSTPKHVFLGNTAPVNNEMRPSNFEALPLTSSKVLLKWKDNSPLEDGFEIWRRNASSEGVWVLVNITRPSISFLYDSLLQPGHTYHYKIRAISNLGRSDYFPGDGSDDNLVITMPDNSDTPSAPQGLTGNLVSVNSIQLRWSPANDESGIKEYRITANDKTYTTAVTEYLLTEVEPNTLYSIYVSAVDISGNISSPSNQILINTRTTGLFYKHSTGAWQSLDEPTMEDTWRTPEYTGSVSNINIDIRKQEDYFNFEFEGYLFIDTPGEYVFYLNSNDGSRLFLDDRELIDFDGVHGRCYGDASSTSCPNGWGRPSTRVTLGRGPHLFRLRMFEYTGGQDVKVYYNGPDTDNSTIQLPDEAFTSGGGVSTNNPSRPVDVAGRATGMTSIQVTWNNGDEDECDFEVYRSSNSAGPFNILHRTSSSSFDDTNLTPSTPYWYRIRAVRNNGISSYSGTIEVRTSNDDKIPSTPEGLIVDGGNFAKAILKWDPSTDNVGVRGYEVWGNGKKVGFSQGPAFEFVLPENGVAYTFYVIAVDFANNKSGRSSEVTNEALITSLESAGNSLLSLNIYPNPASANTATVVIKTPYRKPCSLSLTDLSGRVVQVVNFTPDTESTTVELVNSGGSGLYIVRLAQSEHVLSEKLVFVK